MSGTMLEWRAITLVAFGGAFGSVLRYVIQSLVVARFGIGFPWATFGINVTGSFLIGVVTELAARDATVVSPLMRIFLAVGVLGGFTTFSSFSVETLGLVRTASAGPAFGYAAGSVIAGFAAAYLGAVLGRGSTAI